MTYYSREIKMPVTKKDGLLNFIQMIINRAESGNTNEALLTAVNLYEDVRCGIYDGTIQEKDKAFQALRDELAKKHAAEMAEAITKAHSSGVEEGRRLQKQDTAKALGLI